MSNLTINFSIKEFRPNGQSSSWIPDFKLQTIFIQELANSLQIIRNMFGKPLIIGNGIRGASDFMRLIEKGYHPSPTSDHFFGNVVPIGAPHRLYPILGHYYSFSVGAADVISDNPMGLFNLAIQLNESGKTSFGQIIHETDPIKKTEWVHFGNKREKFYSEIICNLIGKEKYLYTIDGGITYQPYRAVL